jgi:hypothetical protein
VFSLSLSLSLSLIIFNYFYFFTVQPLPHSLFLLPHFSSHLIPTPISPRGWKPCQVELFLGASSLSRFRCTFFHWGHTWQFPTVNVSMSLGCLLGSSVMERSQGSRLVETVGFPMRTHSTSISSSFYLIKSQESLTSQMVGCKYLCLSQCAACWTSQRTAMLGSCLHAHHNIRSSVRSWSLSFWWIPISVGRWTTFPPVFSPVLSLKFFKTGTILGQNFWLWNGNPVPLLDALSFYLRCTLQVPFRHYWAFHLRFSRWLRQAADWDKHSRSCILSERWDGGMIWGSVGGGMGSVEMMGGKKRSWGLNIIKVN